MKILFAAAAIAAVSGAASAQEFYIGAGVDLQTPHSGDQSVASTIMGGAQFGNGPVTFGPELEMNLTNGGDYNALRLRGIARHDTGAVALMASVGYTNYDVDGSGAVDGLNYGLGIDYELSQSVDLRAELIRDHAPDDDMLVTNVRFGAVYGF
ncbi:hypothetical protein BVC71_10285 [Marivivens niveibacter]|uniref:Outer membrane protein beta-barrel domain-containing protein n=1 Tax=Marivivens niveibacter TaxID=1930667 RepID=A0A251WX80_9RHOB|nr:porin [Marivivens niveibacter]OUD09089.1 hypothetical protein BVC71_10285 [Marivivens niveibacter]